MSVYDEMAACASYCEAASLTQVNVEPRLIIEAAREMGRGMTKTQTAEGGATMGRRIAALRERQRLTQTVLAQRADISPTFLSELENDHRGVGVDTLVRIATALNTSLDYLARGIMNEPVTVNDWRVAQIAEHNGALPDGHPAKLTEADVRAAREAGAVEVSGKIATVLRYTTT